MIVTAAVKSVEALSLCRGPPRRSAVAHRMIGKLPTRAHVEVEGRSGGGGTRLTVTSTRAHPHIPFSDYPVVPNKCELSWDMIDLDDPSLSPNRGIILVVRFPFYSNLMILFSKPFWTSMDEFFNTRMNYWLNLLLISQFPYFPTFSSIRSFIHVSIYPFTYLPTYLSPQPPDNS